MPRIFTRINPKIIYVDIDNTICVTNGTDYENSIPIKPHINRLNKLFDHGCGIVYYTARGVGTGKDLTRFTTEQLDYWGCKYASLRMDKPVFDFIVDDRSVQPNALVDRRLLPKPFLETFPW